MSGERMSVFLERLRRAFVARDALGDSDGELVQQYVERGEASAFESLVRRHGPMVLSVCRRVLGNFHDAEDALQATFCVLVQKAAGLKNPEAVSNWLYGVAYRTALKAKTMRAARDSKELRVEIMHAAQPTKDDVWKELQPVLDEEINTLPDKYRAALVLCGLEGKTKEAAAQQLGVPAGTISSRLARARNLLRERLERRGFAVPAAFLLAWLSEDTASAAMSSTLLASTLKAAGAAAGHTAGAGILSAKVATLTKGVLAAMSLGKTKGTIVGAIVALLLAAGGGGYWVFRPSAHEAKVRELNELLIGEETIARLKKDLTGVAESTDDSDPASKIAKGTTAQEERVAEKVGQAIQDTITKTIDFLKKVDRKDRARVANDAMRRMYSNPLWKKSMKKCMDDFFALPKDQQLAELDKAIKLQETFMVPMMKKLKNSKLGKELAELDKGSPEAAQEAEKIWLDVLEPEYRDKTNKYLQMIDERRKQLGLSPLAQAAN
jgi:RNA polymerase sigma factor (sigma-70 family)